MATRPKSATTTKTQHTSTTMRLVRGPDGKARFVPVLGSSVTVQARAVVMAPFDGLISPKDAREMNSAQFKGGKMQTRERPNYSTTNGIAFSDSPSELAKSLGGPSAKRGSAVKAGKAYAESERERIANGGASRAKPGYVADRDDRRQSTVKVRMGGNGVARRAKKG